MLPKIFNPKGKITRQEAPLPDSPSSYDLTSETGVSHFKHGGELGRGTFGTVYLLEATNSSATAVVKHIEEEKLNPHLEYEVDREIAFYKAVYPGIGIHKIPLPPLPGMDNPRFRIVMPRFAEDLFLTAMLKRKDSLLALVLNSAKELERIHNLGILHGDITRKNVLVADDTVYYIDFNWAYLLSRPYARCTSEQDILHFPSERKIAEGQAVPKPHFSQDIYSYAYMIYESLTHLPSFDLPPEVFTWLYCSLSNDPQHRRPLAELISTIEEINSPHFQRNIWRISISRLAILDISKENAAQRSLLNFFLASQLVKEESHQRKSLDQLTEELENTDHRANIISYFNFYIQKNSVESHSTASTSSSISANSTDSASTDLSISTDTPTAQISAIPQAIRAANLILTEQTTRANVPTRISRIPSALYYQNRLLTNQEDAQTLRKRLPFDPFKKQ